MMRDEDDGPPNTPTVSHTVGEALDALSVEDLRERIALLRNEIARLDVALLAKQASRNAADAFFKLE